MKGIMNLEELLSGLEYFLQTKISRSQMLIEEFEAARHSSWIVIKETQDIKSYRYWLEQIGEAKAHLLINEVK